MRTTQILAIALLAILAIAFLVEIEAVDPKKQSPSQRKLSKRVNKSKIKAKNEIETEVEGEVESDSEAETGAPKAWNFVITDVPAAGADICNQPEEEKKIACWLDRASASLAGSITKDPAGQEIKDKDGKVIKGLAAHLVDLSKESTLRNDACKKLINDDTTPKGEILVAIGAVNTIITEIKAEVEKVKAHLSVAGNSDLKTYAQFVAHVSDLANKQITALPALGNDLTTEPADGKSCPWLSAEKPAAAAVRPSTSLLGLIEKLKDSLTQVKTGLPTLTAVNVFKLAEAQNQIKTDFKKDTAVFGAAGTVKAAA